MGLTGVTAAVHDSDWCTRVHEPNFAFTKGARKTMDENRRVAQESLEVSL
jgi:hypothetical protein